MCFLSHLSGDEGVGKLLCEPYRFLSHLSGDEGWRERSARH